MRVGIYNRYWNTAGGGEAYAGTIAEVLAEEHDVFLISEEPIDTLRLRDRLGVRVEHLPQTILGEVDDGAFGDVTASFDLFVNCSHGSRRPSAARRSIYVAFFPETGGDHTSSAAIAILRRRLHRRRHVGFGRGIHAEEREGLRSWRWTESRGELLVTLPHGAAAVLEIDMSTAARPQGTEAQVRIVVDGVHAATHGPLRGPASFSLPLRGSGRTFVVTIETEPFRPNLIFGIDDERELGVQIEDIRLVGRRFTDRVASRLLPETRSVGPSDGFLDSYGVIVSISTYTQSWVWRRWGRRSIRIQPPVQLRSPGEKAPMILSVGRFFSPQSGHSKRQLEMIEAFRRFIAEQEGWELHLVGGSSPRDAEYLDDVVAAARDLPVHLHVNAPVGVLDELYAKATIYWHATGLGEDERRHPERFEHFGISVVEAMSAGAVPIVHAIGGPAAVVRPGRDGLHFRTIDQLVSATLDLVRDPGRRSELGNSAVARAVAFDRPAFGEHVLRVLDAR